MQIKNKDVIKAKKLFFFIKTLFEIIRMKMSSHRLCSFFCILLTYSDLCRHNYVSSVHKDKLFKQNIVHLLPYNAVVGAISF